MLFNTLKFAIFLTAVFFVYRIVEGSRRLRTLWLVLASYAFYASWDPAYLVLIVASTALDYGVGRAMVASASEGRRRALLGISLVGNLGLLGIFKYGNFLLENLEASAALGGISLSLPRVPGALPVGISFYTFQTLSYTIDLYRRRIEPARNLAEFALFVSFFPQLVAGPIVRASEFLPQLERRPRLDPAAIGGGVVLILSGLIKKMVIADSIRHRIVDPFFDAPGAYNAIEMIASTWSFYLQLYCDFSGYTDVATGAALLFGFQLPLNFQRPGFAKTPLEHWQRWHISLQNWLRDYLYIPLGGSRRGGARTLLNIVIVFTAGGVWHGAGWTYACMGLYNGLLAAGWRRFGPRPSEVPWIGALQTFACLNLIVLSMVGMRPYPIAEAWEALRALGRWGASSGGFDFAALGYVAAALGLHYSPLRWRDGLRDWFAAAPAFVIAAAIVIVGAICSLYAGYADEFYYFQF